jgi:hypothetical protein
MGCRKGNAFLCICENWSLPPLKEEYRLRVFRNKMPRRIVDPKRDEETGGWENYVTTHYINATANLMLLR